MTEQAILEAVQEIFRDNFDDDTLEITRATCADDIEDWDSLEQINLLTAIEKKFNIKFNDREQEPQNHWETGKMADAMILSRETCLNAVQKRKFQTTSKKVVRLDLQN